MNILTFLSGILGSLVAAIICAIIAFLFKRKIRNRISKWLLAITNVGAISVYKSPDDTNYKEDLKSEIEKAKEIRVFTSRGRFLEENPFLKCFSNNRCVVQILLPNTEIKNPNWTKSHYEMLYGEEKYDYKIIRDLIESKIDVLRKTHDKIEIRKYHSVLMGRIIITDNVVFFTPYCLDNTHPNEASIYMYSYKSDMYRWCQWMFKQIWQNSDEII